MAKIAFWGNSLTEGVPGAAYIDIIRAVQQNHTVENYGKGGDTVRSLYERAEQLQQSRPEKFKADVVFVWMGVNDVLPQLARFYPPMKTVVRQPWAHTETEFSDYYRRLLDLFNPRCRHIWAVAPLFIGEDLENPWNRRLELQAQLISKLASVYERAAFLDIRRPFIEILAKDHQQTTQISTYLPIDPFQVAADFLTYRSASKADQRAEERGLHFTMDGVHLNSAGAQIVADEFNRAIVQSP
ncbi:MAG: GDSL-type esterase/lipase family protein [Spirochaetia bacterium]|nr:GDSL-type esterase/lipase family protein [Spirochaetia bacterium]